MFKAPIFLLFYPLKAFDTLYNPLSALKLTSEVEAEFAHMFELKDMF